MKNKEIINEVFQGTPAIRARLRNTPIVSKRKFIQMAEPCDIFVTKTPGYNLKTSSSRVISKMLSFAQGSPYTSSKLLLPDGNLIGYGVDYDQDPTYLSKMKLKDYMIRCDFACMVRVPNITEEQKQKVYKYLLDRQTVPYNKIGLLKTAWNKIMPDFVRLDFKIEEPEDRRVVRGYKKALFCSTIISMAFLYIGIVLFEKPLEAWPRNFILTPKAILVSRTSG